MISSNKDTCLFLSQVRIKDNIHISLKSLEYFVITRSDKNFAKNDFEKGRRSLLLLFLVTVTIFKDRGRGMTPFINSSFYSLSCLISWKSDHQKVLKKRPLEQFLTIFSIRNFFLIHRNIVVNKNQWKICAIKTIRK